MELRKWEDLMVGTYVLVKYPPANAKSRADAEKRPVYKPGIVVGTKRVELESGAKIDIENMKQLLIETGDDGKPRRSLMAQ